MSVASALIIVFFSVLAGAFFSGSETGLYCVNRIKLRFRAHQGYRSASRIQQLLKDPGKTIIAILIGNNVTYFIATGALTSLFERYYAEPELIATLILTPILFIFSEVLPKNLFQRKADTLIYHVHAPLVFVRYLFAPAIWGLTAASNLLAKLIHAEAKPPGVLYTRQGLQYVFQESRGATISPYQSQIAENIMSLHRRRLADAMIPLDEVESIDIGISVAELHDYLLKVRHSRLPVYEREKSNVVGILNIFDFLYEKEHQEGIRHLVQPGISFDTGTTINTALHRMQAERQLLAIVVDNTGKATGIVALKDIVEEIVGELAEA